MIGAASLSALERAYAASSGRGGAGNISRRRLSPKANPKPEAVWALLDRLEMIPFCFQQQG